MDNLEDEFKLAMAVVSTALFIAITFAACVTSLSYLYCDYTKIEVVQFEKNTMQLQ